MSTLIAIANQKGGVGKTTTAVDLTAAFAYRDKRTLLIDSDPQADTTLTFFNLDEIPHLAYEVLADHRMALSQVVRPTNTEATTS